MPDYARFFETVPQTFVLAELPPGTPPDAEFYLQTGLEQDQPDRPELKFQREDGAWVLRRDYPLGTLLAYKVTRGTRETEEGDAWGQRRPDRKVVLDRAMTHRIEVQRWMDGPRSERPSTLSGHIERVPVHSPELDADIELLVYLPPSYERGDKHYPVLYLHDGQNVFDAATSYCGEEWGCDEAAETLACERLECIMVGIPVRGEQRNRDYTPFKAEVNGYAPDADAYLAFLTDTVKPRIDTQFRTRPEVAQTALAGSSFGGLISLYGGLSRPDVFGTIGAFSPSLWVGDGALLRWTDGQTAPDSQVYLDMGTHEGEFAQDAAVTVHQTQLYAASLADRMREVKLEIGAGHWHDEPAWAARFPGFLRWFLESEQT